MNSFHSLSLSLGMASYCGYLPLPADLGFIGLWGGGMRGKICLLTAEETECLGSNGLAECLHISFL